MLRSLCQKEGITGSEVAEHHQVAEGLHDIPTQIMECSKHNEGKLPNDHGRAQEAVDICNSRCSFPNLIDFLLVWSKLTLKLSKLLLNGLDWDLSLLKFVSVMRLIRVVPQSKPQAVDHLLTR